MKDKPVQENPKTRRRTKPRNSRPTIGFVTGHRKYPTSRTVWQGVTDAARERDVNVISFLARDLETFVGFDAQGNVLYKLVNPDMLDGLVVWVTPRRMVKRRCAVEPQ